MRVIIFYVMVGLEIFVFAGKGLFAQEQDEYQKWLQKDQQEYRQFLQKEDKEFADFLKKDWEAFNTQQGIKPLVKPKPVSIPKAPKKPQPKPPVPIKKVQKLPPPPPKPKYNRPKPAPPKPEPQMIRFKFFSEQVQLPKLSGSLKPDLSSPLSNIKISNAWKTFASAGQTGMVNRLKQYKTKLGLNDWGFIQLVRRAACEYTAGANDCMAYTWFLLNKLGYDAKVAYKNDQLFLLMPSKNLMYEQPFVVINKQKYYFISFGRKLNLTGKIFTYKGNYQNAENPIALSINHLPRLPQNIKKRVITFTYNSKSYSVPAEYDAEQVSFFKEYPQTELRLYFEAPASSYLNYSLLGALRKLVKGRNELDAVNLLLRFVQTGFQYKTDDQQFGHEKYMLPDETVYYPSSDCEDRAILFAYLVRHLLGLKVVGLDYPNHVSTAVRFHSEIPGKAVQYRGERYVICDPTYINANAGMEMPEFEHTSPKVIAF